MTKRVLVVEDDVLVGLDIAQQLTDVGLEVVGPAISVARAFSGKVESGRIPKEARIRFKIPTGTRGPVMNGEAILRRPA